MTVPETYPGPPVDVSLRGDTTVTALKTGQEVADVLADALKLAGITLPSLKGGFPVLGRPLIELGGCPTETALALAAWIRERA